MTRESLPLQLVPPFRSQRFPFFEILIGSTERLAREALAVLRYAFAAASVCDIPVNHYFCFF